jgi:thiol peroxidase
MSRAIVIIDESGKVSYTELVPKIVQEPNYEAAPAVLS